MKTATEKVIADEVQVFAQMLRSAEAKKRSRLFLNAESRTFRSSFNP